MTYLTREDFNKNINEIFEKSKLIGDSWKLLKASNNQDALFYLERIEQKCIKPSKQDETKAQDLESTRSEIYTFVYHVIFSDSYSVPVLYLNVYKSNGSSLNYDELYSYFNLNSKLNDAYDLVITQQEHPILFKPFYFVHPCKTADWMIATNPNQNESILNYTLKWMSFVFASFNINLDVKYGLTLDKLKTFV